MLETLLERAEKNIKLLDEYVGKPSNTNFPQTTNQAIIIVLRDLQQSIVLLKQNIEILLEDWV
jgi:hypothetical protein